MGFEFGAKVKTPCVISRHRAGKVLEHRKSFLAFGATGRVGAVLGFAGVLGRALGGFWGCGAA